MDSPFTSSDGSQLAAADGSIHPNALRLPGVTALTCRPVPYLVDHRVVAAERIEAIYWPDASRLARELAPGSRLLGFVRHRLNLTPGRRKPRVLFLHGPRYAIPDQDAGTWETWEPLPAGIDPDHRIQDGLEAEIVRLLGHRTVAECCRLTLAPRNLVEAIADCLPAYQRDAMKADGARPGCLAITRVALIGKEGVRHEALHVIAWDGARDRAWTLAVLDRALGEEDLAACLAEAITDLPHPESLVFMVTGASAVTRRVVAEAMAMAQIICPAFTAEAVVLRPGGRQPRTRAQFGDAVARLKKSLKALWHEAPLTVERFEQRALVRQGYCARRRPEPTTRPRQRKTAAWVTGTELLCASKRPPAEIV